MGDLKADRPLLLKIVASAIAAAPAAAAAQTHDMGGMQMSDAAMAAMPRTRDASGTSWQPDVTPHEGLHTVAGDWLIMTHLRLNGVWDDQGGPRGDERGFVSGMLMSMATRAYADGGRLQFRGMLSPDPLMKPHGYPLLLASGETANGVTPLVDRQHPHDLVMELSARYDRPAGPGRVVVYAGLPGEPAFGPPAFMHRASIEDSPEAPISHHWLDSTHISWGVVTLGYQLANWQLEASRFRGREPDRHRWDLESPKLDSTAVRLSWNPTPNWALQASWAHQKSPEELDPHENQTKWSASAIYTGALGDNGWWATTLAWGRKNGLDAYALEATAHPSPLWTVFARAEQTENDELLGLHGPTFRVAKASLGAIRDWRAAPHVKLGLGALYAWNRIPAGLEPSYGGDPHGGMVFLRLKVE
jgi:hypothetical protein